LEVARTLNNIGILNRLQGRLDKAEELEKQALAIAEKAAGADSPLVAFILNAWPSPIRPRADTTRRSASISAGSISFKGDPVTKVCRRRTSSTISRYRIACKEDTARRKNL
jgi:hypothetical protein